jgi:hypothetical protein
MERPEQHTYTTKYEKAKVRVKELKGFYNHLIAYLVVIAGLAGLNYYTNEFRYAWFLWTAFGWGIGLISHAFKTFYSSIFCGKQWEERKIKEMMDTDASFKDSTSFGRWE